MDELIIDEHALMHGLAADDIEYAWYNFVAKMHRGAPKEGEIIAVGYDGKGRFLEMVGAERPFATIVFHAISPPTRNAMRELGMEKG
ncbi:MAG: hypothetical protein IJ131_08830 [Eggerthellaceae bacterium]|nr:hypothetical protein [Eggerthellaceae bacterium]